MRILCIYKLKPCKMYLVAEKMVVKMRSSYGPDLTLLDPSPL